jgi:endonuclease/exonuclease/phosphatase (EEP) superfamily protein YafD
VEDNFLGIPFDHIYYLTCADSKIFSALNGGDLNQSAIVERLKNFYTLQQALSILE